MAASSGQQELVKWLLERGASVHVRDVNNETPLLAAVKAGHLEIVSVRVGTSRPPGGEGELGVDLLGSDVEQDQVDPVHETGVVVPSLKHKGGYRYTVTRARGSGS